MDILGRILKESFISTRNRRGPTRGELLDVKESRHNMRVRGKKGEHGNLEWEGDFDEPGHIAFSDDTRHARVSRHHGAEENFDAGTHAFHNL